MSARVAIADDAIGITGGSRGHVGGVVDRLLAAPQQVIETVELGRLHENPDNPREAVGDVADLAASIASVGVLEPLIVASAGAWQAVDDRLPFLTATDYVVIAGHRRRTASELAGAKTAPCIVRDDLVGADADVAMLIENVHREDLTAIEEARSFQRLETKHGKSQREIAKLVGCNQSHVSKRLALLKLPDDIQALVGSDEMPVADAVEISKHADNPKAVKAILNRPSYQSVDDAVAAVTRQADQAAAIAAAKERLTNQGIQRIVKYDGYSYDNSVPRKLSYLAQDGLDVDAHIHSDCHAVAVGYSSYGDELHIVPVCTNPKSHPESRDNKRDASTKAAQAKREREAKAAARQRAGRRETLRAALTAKTTSADTQHLANRLAFHDLSEYFDDRDYEEIASILGVKLPETDDPEPDAAETAVKGYADTGPNELRRALVASVLFKQEGEYERGWSSTASADLAYLEWLSSHGHKLTGPEAKRLKANAS